MSCRWQKDAHCSRWSAEKNTHNSPQPQQPGSVVQLWFCSIFCARWHTTLRGVYSSQVHQISPLTSSSSSESSASENVFGFLQQVAHPGLRWHVFFFIVLDASTLEKLLSYFPQCAPLTDIGQNVCEWVCVHFRVTNCLAKLLTSSSWSQIYLFLKIWHAISNNIFSLL